MHLHDSLQACVHLFTHVHFRAMLKVHCTHCLGLDSISIYSCLELSLGKVIHLIILYKNILQIYITISIYIYIYIYISIYAIHHLLYSTLFYSTFLYFFIWLSFQLNKFVHCSHSAYFCLYILFLLNCLYIFVCVCAFINVIQALTNVIFIAENVVCHKMASRQTRKQQQSDKKP